MLWRKPHASWSSWPALGEVPRRLYTNLVDVRTATFSTSGGMSAVRERHSKRSGQERVERIWSDMGLTAMSSMLNEQAAAQLKRDVIRHRGGNQELLSVHSTPRVDNGSGLGKTHCWRVGRDARRLRLAQNAGLRAPRCKLKWSICERKNGTHWAPRLILQVWSGAATLA
jgi:hypothetical protein